MSTYRRDATDLFRAVFGSMAHRRVRRADRRPGHLVRTADPTRPDQCAIRPQNALAIFCTLIARFRHVDRSCPGRQRVADQGEKGNLQFPLDQPIPYQLIERITKLRVKQDSSKASTKPKNSRQENREQITETARCMPPRRHHPPSRRAGMPSPTLRVVPAARRNAGDALRPGELSHAERGHEFNRCSSSVLCQDFGGVQSLPLWRCCRRIGRGRVQNSPTMRANRRREHAC